MSRSASAAAIKAMFSQETDEAFLCLLHMSHADWASDFRFVNDKVNHTDAAAEEWIGFPFDIRLPDDREDEIAAARLSIDNVDRQIVEAVRGISSSVAVTLWIVLSSDIDDVIAGPFSFNLNSVNWDAMTVSGSLEYEPILNIKYPQHRFTPVTTPALFKA